MVKPRFAANVDQVVLEVDRSDDHSVLCADNAGKQVRSYPLKPTVPPHVDPRPGAEIAKVLPRGRYTQYSVQDKQSAAPSHTGEIPYQVRARESVRACFANGLSIPGQSVVCRDVHLARGRGSDRSKQSFVEPEEIVG